MVSKNKADVKREFDAFAEKVARLESFRHQLETLNTKGFEHETKSIRAKLNDINAISQVAREIDELRRKISRQHKTGEESKKEHEKISAMGQYLERKTEGMRHKIVQLEKEIAEKKKVSGRKQLTSEEVDYVRDMPKLEHELKKLNNLLEEHLKSHKVKIDAGVGLIVDTKFDDFISEIKAELTERLKEKETLMDKELGADLKDREIVFADKYKTLVEEFHKRYRQKVHDELGHEVKKNFESALHNRLENEKRRIVDSLVRENVRRLHGAKKKLIEQLEQKYTGKERRLQVKLEGIYRKKTSKLRVKVGAKMNVVNLKLDRIKKAQEKLEAKRKAVSKELAHKGSELGTRSRAVRMRLDSRRNELEKMFEKVRMEKSGMEKQRASELKSLGDERKRLENKTRGEREGLKRKHDAILRKESLEMRSSEKELARLIGEGKTRLKKKDEEREDSYRKREKKLGKEYLKKEKALERNIGGIKKEHVQLESERNSVMERVERAKKKILANQSRVLASKRKFLDSIVQRKMKQIQAETRKLKSEGISHAKDEAVREAALRKEEGAFSKEKKAKFGLLEQEHLSLAGERKALQDKFASLQRLEKEEIEGHKKRLDAQLLAHVRNNDGLFKRRVNVLRADMQEKLKGKTLIIMRNSQNAIENEVKKRETIIRGQMEREYDQKLKNEVARREIQLQKKKELLEKHVMDNLKKALS